MKRFHFTACCFCGRSSRECWTMPCLELDNLLKSDNAKALKGWARKSGVKLVAKVPT